jgi:hypothetical protein
MITDYFLNEVAKGINNETFVVPAYQAVGTGSVTAINTTDTALTGEIGSRIALSGTRTNNSITFSGTRSGASVLDSTSGDTLTNVGILAVATSGTLLQGVVIGTITHTTSFDIEFTNSITVNRA